MSGYGVQIVPLEHVSASEIEKILTPFIPVGTTLRIDATRNLLILSGPRYRLDHLLETIKVFDVDWLKGMSFGMFPLHYADATILVGEIEKVIGAEGQTPFAGIVRLVPIERLNAILVIAHQPKHMTAVRRLIEQFDWGTEASPGRRLYVYHVKYGNAENISGVLQELFAQVQETGQTSAADGIQELPPGMAGGNNAFRTAKQVSKPPPPVGAPGAGGDYPEPTALAIFNNSNETRMFFDLLASKSNVKFISAPQVMVHDNQTATIRVGDQIPVTTRSLRAPSTRMPPLLPRCSSAIPAPCSPSPRASTPAGR